MKRTSISALAASALVAAFAAAPAGAEPSFDGNSCHGAQLSSVAHFFGGVGNSTEETGFSVKEGQEFLREFFPCR